MVPTGSAVMGVTCLKLTQWGENFVSAFPQAAVDWANEHYFRATVRGSDPFKKFVRLCVDWCNQQGVKPNWATMYQQQRLMGQPIDAPMFVPQDSPKREGSQSLGARKPSSSFGGTPQTPLSPHEVLIGGIKYRVLSATEMHERQAAFINNPDMVAGVDKLSLLIGKQAATNYFKKVFDNLKYQEVK